MLKLVFMCYALEGVAAYFAAQNATAEDIAAMEAALAASGRFMERTAWGTSWRRATDLFHATLRRQRRNDYLVGLLGK
jgi:DNA-binding GntR family transcriptional regulator